MIVFICGMVLAWMLGFVFGWVSLALMTRAAGERKVTKEQEVER